MPATRLATAQCIRLTRGNTVGRNGILDILTKTGAHLLNFIIPTNIWILIPVHSGTTEKVQKGINGDLENINSPSRGKKPLCYPKQMAILNIYWEMGEGCSCASGFHSAI